MGTTEFLVAKNRSYSKLVTAIDDDDVSVVVTAGEGSRFPDTYPFDITIENEIMRCTNRATDTLTVTRAQQGTSAVAHSVGVMVSLNITAKFINDLNTAVNFIEQYADYGLAFFGVVTTYTDTTHFKVAGLLGLGASTFLPASGTPYEIFVFKADGAAPQGEQTPVVAYTTADGTFQHAAFTSPLAVDDEVLIIHPLLASLGTKATAAATGAVTTTDYMMAYIKQLVTELQVLDALVDAIKAVTDVIPDAGALTALLASIASILEDTETTLPATLTTIDTVVDGIQTDLSNVTDGLGALKDLIDAVQTDVGDPTGETLASISAKIGDIARSLDVIIGARWDASGDLGTDIGQLLTYTDILDDATNGLANIKSLIDTLTTNVGTVDTVVDGIQTDLSNVTDGLGALKDLIDAVQAGLGDVGDTAHTTFPSAAATALAYLKGQQIAQGLCYYGDITGYTDTKNFASTTLATFETGFFNGWTCFLIKDDAGAGATPQGARAVIDTFTTTTGAIVLKTALPSAGAVGDQIMLVHPILLDAWNMRGGVRSLETLGEDQDAGLDVARGKYTKTMTGGADDLYGESSDTEFVLQEFRVDLHNMAEGDTIVFKVLTTEDGTERQISDDEANTFTGAQDPARVEIIGSANQVWGREDISITATQTTGTNREIVCYWRDAKRGS